MEGEDSSRGRKQQEEEGGISSRLKNGCLSTVVSLQESFGYFKAFFVGQGKKLMARSEEELTAADLEESKMQVEAADAAEDAKNRIHES